MQAKTKQQRQQEKKLAVAKQQAKSHKADLKQTPGKQTAKPPVKKKGGFFDGLLERFFGRADKPHTVQQTIPYREMYKDGTCRVDARRFNKTISFDDINYPRSS